MTPSTSCSDASHMLVAFYSPHLCLRGTSVATFDYARGNESVLGNESVVLYDRLHHNNHPASVQHFAKHLRVIALDDRRALDKTLQQLRADACYVLKGGFRDGVESKACSALIHATAMAPACERHGTRFAYVSEWMSDTLSGGQLPFVPHMIDLPHETSDMREELSIPVDATVFGRTGGMDTWNIHFACIAVEEALRLRDDLWFIFQNTPRFSSHERIRYIDCFSDLYRKVKFINSCDAMLHARHEGESFGLACGEFSSRNKPVITWLDSPERSHIAHLGDRGLYYRDVHELIQLLVNFQKRPLEDWNRFRDFNRERVMTKFREVFLS